MTRYTLDVKISKPELQALLRWRSLDGGLHVLLVAVADGQPIALLGELPVETLGSRLTSGSGCDIMDSIVNLAAMAGEKQM